MGGMSVPYIQINKKQVPVNGKLVIGRHEECSIVLTDNQASRNHCMVEKVGRNYVARDLDSRNGTKVNGEPISSVVLASNDVITIGTTNLKFVNDNPEPAGEGGVDELSADDIVEVDRSV